MKLSHHSKIRMGERANIPKNAQKQLFFNALRKGKVANNIKDKKLKKYVYQLESTGCQVKVYNGYIFIHSKNKKQLITMYKIPDDKLEGK